MQRPPAEAGRFQADLAPWSADEETRFRPPPDDRGYVGSEGRMARTSARAGLAVAGQVDGDHSVGRAK